MRLLLDTHALHWAAAAPEKLSPTARAALEDPENVVSVSVISAWELLLGARKGRLDLGPDPGAFVADALRPFSSPHAIDLAIVLKSQALPGYANPDPADRFLVATAIVLDLHIVTADRSMREWAGVRSLW